MTLTRDEKAAEADHASYPYDLGSYRRTVTASSAAAQEWFNRGLLWSYGFNHEEAARCFERALALDPGCALAHWGLALALGPNYNKPWHFFDPEELEAVVRQTHAAVERAQSCLADDGVQPVERALVEALKFRFPHEHAAEDEDVAVWNRNYADAMARVYDEFADDLDVAALYAGAIMDLTPWQLWDVESGQPKAGSRTLEARRVLERAMAQDGGSRHPALLHLYIHLMEMSPTPEAAVDAANTLRDLVPHSGHLVHMPSHIDVLVGDYQSAIESNQRAIVADELFFEHGDPLMFYNLYRCHDYHFRIYAAMFAAQSRVCLDTVSGLEKALPEALLRVESPPMADWMEGLLAMRVHALIRFGRWRDVMELRPPGDTALYCVTHAMILYGKGVAAAAVGDIAGAAEQRGRFAAAAAAVPDSRMLFNNKCTDVLRVAAAMLDGELAYRRGDHEAAFAHLRTANERCYALPYDEPWGWMQPPSHALGALLAEQGRYGEALELYAADLGISGKLARALQHPGNVWALHGYHECLVKLGRAEEAQAIRPRLEKALAGADIPIKASCFCRSSANGE
ncbi:TPR domain protein [Xylariaceae sp. FL0804]|nr:TPR domain protein [Xylariaceae sp. FL0804]